jgi:hypothetical protein
MRNYILKTFFRVDGAKVFCLDINGIYKGLQQEHNPSVEDFSSNLRSEV